MHLILLVIQLALAMVFAVAGTAKLLDFAGTRESLQNFGAPKQFTATLAALLPLCELAIAVGLMFTSTSWTAAIAALVLLLVFLAGIGFSISRGRTPDCHCFGQLYSRPVGAQTIVRNVLFAAGAIFVIWTGREQQIGLPLPAATSLFFIIVALVAYGYRKRSNSTQIQTELPEGLPIGSLAPAFELPDYEEGTRTLNQLLESGKRLLLIFTSPFCGPCVHLFQEVASWQRAHSEEIKVVIISRGTIKENFVNTVKNGLQNVLLQRHSEVADLYQARLTPTAVIVDRNGRIGSSLSAGADEIRALLKTVLEAPAESRVPIGRSLDEKFLPGKLQRDG